MDQPTVREIITGDQYCECGAMYDVTKEELIAVIEDGWTTTLMSTDQNAPSARRAIALAAVTFAISFGMEIDTQAKDKGHALSMIEHLGKAAKLLEWEL